ncbi:B3 domain-containing transcription factor VRN1-like [Abrus precatorius]|uniref:B3 domain-containing transcription factor VRN1-like n=1 Tax=Abrus precatorius TaxID=3816 RepID=A0A8B8JUR8_ABRPR|nr:B3 domain-containing transcription factor VRN1-like [Abrus precatorius]
MTSKLHHGDGCDDGASKPIHFFRIIHRDNLIMQEKLRLPVRFVRKYEKHLPNTMFLKLPNGAEWKVNLEKSDGSVWFQKGWKEFVEYHSLAHGNFLVFRYDGASHFHVLILDLSTMEIDYPVNKSHKRASKREEIQPRKTQKTNGNIKNESDSKLKEAFHKKFRDCKGMILDSKRRFKKHTEGSSISNRRTHDAAGNTSFTVMIKSSHLNKYMYLPKGSLKGYIKPGGQNVTLLVRDKSWRVNLIHYQDKSTSYFTAHWSTFARENHLKKGDTCLFQLLESRGDMVMKVSISN